MGGEDGAARRRYLLLLERWRNYSLSADWKSAIQQSGTLRYDCSGTNLSWISGGIDIGDGDALAEKVNLGDVIREILALNGGDWYRTICLQNLRFENTQLNVHEARHGIAHEVSRKLALVQWRGTC